MRKRINDHLRQNIALAKNWIGKLEKQKYQALVSLSQEYGFSIALGDLILLDGKWYVSHTGLIRLAQRCRCSGISVKSVRDYCDPSNSRWVFRATVYKSPRSRGFVGYGDADPSNVSSLGPRRRNARRRNPRRQPRPPQGLWHRFMLRRGTRLVPACTAEPARCQTQQPAPSWNNGHSNGQPRLRDRLCLLIRQHKLDANLVKPMQPITAGLQF